MTDIEMTHLYFQSFFNKKGITNKILQNTVMKNKIILIWLPWMHSADGITVHL